MPSKSTRSITQLQPCSYGALLRHCGPHFVWAFAHIHNKLHGSDNNNVLVVVGESKRDNMPDDKAWDKAFPTSHPVRDNEQPAKIILAMQISTAVVQLNDKCGTLGWQTVGIWQHLGD